MTAIAPTLLRRIVSIGMPVATIVVLVTVALGLFIDRSNADGLLSTLMSTQELTFFYWGQDRLANVVPAMTIPIRDEIWNFYAQSAIRGASFFALVLLFAGFHLRSARTAVSSTLLSLSTLAVGLLVVVLLDGHAGMTFIFEQPYAFGTVAFLVGIWAMIASPMSARLAGAALIVIGTLVNPTVIVFCPVAFVLVEWSAAGLRRASLAAAAAIGALGVTVVATKWFYAGPSQADLYNDYSLRRAMDGLPTAVDNILGSVRIIPTLITVVVAGAVLVARRRSLSRQLQVAYAAAVPYGAFFVLAFSANRWVEINLHSYRYFFPLYCAALFVIAGAVTELVTIAADWYTVRLRSGRPPSKRVALAATAAVYAVLGVAAIGGLTRATPIVALSNARPLVEAARANDAQLLVGNYWVVWPAVIQGRAEGLDLLGVSYRSDPIADEILDAVDDELTDGQVALLCVDGDAARCMTEFSQFSGRTWALASASESGPLVIQVIPAAP